jgi:hypothetical protein
MGCGKGRTTRKRPRKNRRLTQHERRPGEISRPAIRENISELSGKIPIAAVTRYLSNSRCFEIFRTLQRWKDENKMNSFAMIFGKCVWTPPSPKAATIALAYFFGTLQGVPAETYENALRQQLVAAGSSERAAAAEIKWLDECFASCVGSKRG